MAEADTEDRDLPEELRKLIDDRAGLFGIPGAVGEEHPVGVHRQDLFCRGVRRNDGDRADLAEMAQHCGLHTEVVGHDLPGSAADRVRLGCGHQTDKVDTGRAGFGLGRGQQGGMVGGTECPRHCAGVADVAGESTGVDPGDTGETMAAQIVVEMLLTSPVALAAGEIADDHAPAEGLRRLVVGGVHAVVADVGVGEGDDLTGVAGVGDDLLVAREHRVEHDFTGGEPVRFELAPMPSPSNVSPSARTSWYSRIVIASLLRS